MYCFEEFVLLSRPVQKICTAIEVVPDDKISQKFEIVVTFFHSIQCIMQIYFANFLKLLLHYNALRCAQS